MNKTHITRCLIILLTVSLLQAHPGIPTARAAAITWSCTIHATENSSHFDTIVFGEASDATDGPPPDSHDVAKPPTPPSTPYIRAYLTDNLPYPYNTLWEDYRHYPATTKTWNITIKWNPEDDESPTTVTLTWNTTDLTHSEYTNITLCNATGAPLLNMRTNTSYTFPCPALTAQHYKILCTGGDTSGDGGSDGGSDGGGTTENQAPTADIATTQTTGFVDDPILFNGTKSHDPDGHLVTWAWDFGDGTSGTGATITHIYQAIGSYTVRLTVTDDGGKTGNATTHIHIISTNLPPKQPVITGPTLGEKNQTYTFTVVSIDFEGDPLQYMVNWGDQTHNTSAFLPKGIAYNVTHSWSIPGKYTITATATDNTSLSEPGRTAIFINVTFLGDLGFLYDTDGDGILDTLYINASQTTTPVQRMASGLYTFTINGNVTLTYLYNPATGSFFLKGKETPSAGFPWLLTVGILLALAIIALLVYLYWKKRR